MVAAALIDRLVHHATMVVLKGKSYRLKERAGAVAPAVSLGRSPSARSPKASERATEPVS
jgi:hypothetical protein